MGGSLKFHIGSGGDGGFALVTINSSGLTVTHYSGEGEVVFTAPTLAPRSRSLPSESGTQSSFAFGVMGDWGGSEPPPYTTAEEKTTAQGMGKVLGAQSAAYALALGDNFYSHGVTSEFDSRFQNTFENVFTADSLQGDDYFRVVAGNHDHNGNVTAQIDYSNHSKRWRFDDYYYSFVEPITLPNGSSGTLETILIDTVILAGAEHVI